MRVTFRDGPCDGHDHDDQMEEDLTPAPETVRARCEPEASGEYQLSEHGGLVKDKEPERDSAAVYKWVPTAG